MPALTPESSLSTVVEGTSVLDSSKGGILGKIVLMGIILLVMVAGAKRWFYPHTLDDLKDQIELVNKTIKDNTALGQDLLGDFGVEFRERLAR